MDAHVVCTQGQIVISGEMTIYAATTLKEQLFELVQTAGKSIELDLSQVTALDTSGLQILLMLQRIAGKSGYVCQVVRHSRAVYEVLSLCGLTRMLSVQSSTANEQ